MEHIYDVLILGGGPAGLSAGIYAGRSRLDTLIIEKGQSGGQIALTAELENYPGQLPEGESGPTLSERMAEQARRLGASMTADTIRAADIAGEVKVLEGEKEVYRGRSLIIAAGAAPRPIGCENEARFVGAGISYCATCDGAFFRDLEVFVAGTVCGPPGASRSGPSPMRRSPSSGTAWWPRRRGTGPSRPSRSGMSKPGRRRSSGPPRRTA